MISSKIKKLLSEQSDGMISCAIIESNTGKATYIVSYSKENDIFFAINPEKVLGAINNFDQFKLEESIVVLKPEKLNNNEWICELFQPIPIEDAFGREQRLINSL